MSSSGGVLTSPRAKIRRRRPALSCEQCRRRKIRCSQELPCKACVRSKSAMYCSYKDAGPPRPVESILSPEQSHTNSPSSSISRISSRSAHPATNRVESSSPQQKTLHRQKDNNVKAGARTTAERPAPNGFSVSPVLPRLRQMPEKTKMFGQNHWVHMADKFPIIRNFNIINDTAGLITTQKELADNIKELYLLGRRSKAHRSDKSPLSIGQLPAGFPSRETCDNLVQGYLRTFEPMYRTLHIPTFEQDYRLFWEVEDQQSIHCNTTAQIALVLAIGTTFHCLETDAETERLQELARDWIYAVQAWLTGPGERIGLSFEGLQTYCLMFLARHCTRRCHGPAAWLSPGSLLGMAIGMGLNRDPSLFPELSPFQMEMRRRMWTTVVELALQSSFDQAVPMSILAETSDAPVPENFDDADLTRDPVSTPGPLTRCTDSSVQIHWAKSLSLRLQIMNQAHSFGKDHNYEDVLKLDAELRTAIQDLDVFFSAQTDAETNDISARSRLAPVDFQRKLLSISLYKYALLLHRPFLVQAGTDSKFHFSRKSSIEASIVILSCADGVDLSSPWCDLDDLSKLSIHGRGLFKGPLQMAPILTLGFETLAELEYRRNSVPQPGALDEIGRLSRAPMIRLLDNIEQQLTDAIEKKSVSRFKPLLLTRGVLRQIHWLEAGISPTQEMLIESVAQKIKEILVCVRNRNTEGSQSQILLNHDMMPDLLDDFGTDFAMMGPWDFSTLFNF